MQTKFQLYFFFDEFKILVKSKMRNSAYVEFECVKQGHSKVKHISHTGLKKSQPYLKDSRFSNKETHEKRTSGGIGLSNLQ